MIFILDEVLTSDELSYVQNIAQTFPFIDNYMERHIIGIEEQLANDAVVQDIRSRLANYSSSFFREELQVEWSQITVWPEGSYHDYHVDTTSKQTVFASITYINADYRGGETVFADGSRVCPIQGRTVFFDGLKYAHGVSPICLGTRINIACWYKLKEKNND